MLLSWMMRLGMFEHNCYDQHLAKVHEEFHKQKLRWFLLRFDRKVEIEGDDKFFRKLRIKVVLGNQIGIFLKFILPPEPFFEKKPQSKQLTTTRESGVWLTIIDGYSSVKFVLAKTRDDRRTF